MRGGKGAHKLSGLPSLCDRSLKTIISGRMTRAQQERIDQELLQVKREFRETQLRRLSRWERDTDED